MNNAFSAETVLATLPPVLAEDKKCYAIAYAIAQKMEEAFADVHNAIIYARANELDEATLDQLAEDFGIGWWNQEATLSEKRQMLYDSFSARKKLGTADGVRTAISTYYGDGGSIEEWYDIGLLPGHYKITLSGEYAPQTQSQINDFTAKLETADRASAYHEIHVVLD